MNRFFCGTAVLLIVSAYANAQYEAYPALFGRNTFNGGTARYAAIGGAATSLGGDIGSSVVNPAGLGFYRKSEFSFSPNFGFSGGNSTFLDENERASKGSFGISSFGIALSSAKDDLDKSSWRGGTFSLSMTRVNNFHNRANFSGIDDANSMADFFVERANGNSADDYDQFNNPNDPNSSGITDLGGLAYYTYLVEPSGSNVSQYSNGIQEETVLKEASYTTKGSQNQWNISYGANYKDKFYLGAGVGIATINFREDLNYTETVGFNVNGNFSPSPDTVDYFTFNDYNKVKGTGLNLTLGYIYKINDVVRIGSTIKTPTIYWMNQEFSSDLTVRYAPDYLYFGENLGEQSYATESGFFKFNYTSPLKVSSGISLFAGSNGFVSADVEYVPYQFSDLSGRNSQDDRFLRPANRVISDTYRDVVNLRIGGEVRMDIFKIRAGLAYLPSPYAPADGVNRDVAQFSGGLGARIDDMYIDLGVVNSRFESTYSPYSLNFERTAGAVTKNSLTNVMLTVGFYFE